MANVTKQKDREKRRAELKKAQERVVAGTAAAAPSPSSRPLKLMDPRDLRREAAIQARANRKPEVAKQYAEAMSRGDTFPRLIAYDDGEDCWLADGEYRCEAAEIAGKRLEVEVRHGGQREAILYACSANAAHDMAGERRTNEDKRRAVELMLADPEWKKWVDSEIARRCAVSHQLVGTVRKELSPVAATGESEQRTYTTKHGTTATMDTSGIKAAAAARKATGKKATGKGARSAKGVVAQAETPPPHTTVTASRSVAEEAREELDEVVRGLELGAGQLHDLLPNPITEQSCDYDRAAHAILTPEQAQEWHDILDKVIVWIDHCRGVLYKAATAPPTTAAPSAAPEADKPAAPESAPLLCGGRLCRDDGEKVIHAAEDPGCAKTHPRPK